MYPIGETIHKCEEQSDVKYEIHEEETTDAERAFYGCRNFECIKCKFDGPKDGESAIKECFNVRLIDCDLNLRYPIWHSTNVLMENCRMPDTCRASLWYDNNVTAKNCIMHGIKAFREVHNIDIDKCDINSEEFMWHCHNIKIKDTKIESVYPFFESRNIEIDGMQMNAKYSFQYVEDLIIRNSIIETKDAFWHSKNVTVYDSTIKGEYLAWYSKGLKLVRCKIEGTQPLCYASDLTLIDCEMIDADLAFELSDVKANIIGNIVSVKNPKSGSIEADSIGEIIIEDGVVSSQSCNIKIRNQK